MTPLQIVLSNLLIILVGMLFVWMVWELMGGNDQ